MSAISVMQPYLFPYIGYFQLINKVDRFIFYDDVNFIPRGWINRNKILINGEARYLTIPCKDSSQNKLINEVAHGLNNKTRKKLLRKIKFTYSNAPYFEDVYPLIDSVLNIDNQYISKFAVESVKISCYYLRLDCDFKLSSDQYNNTSLDAADRLIDICKQEGIRNYINPSGGMELYSKEYFQNNGVNLQFLKSVPRSYEQFSYEFVPWLSIIDVMMFNSPEKIKNEFLNSYKLV
ncbi:MAG: WbqC family protein [Bacteroidota bacterium]